MTWVKLDDAMPETQKVADLSDAAFRAYVTSICYSARNLTDGVVPSRMALQLAGRARVVQELTPDPWHVLPNLCERCKEKTTKAGTELPAAGFYIHDYLAYNPCRNQVLEEQARRNEQKSIAGKLGAAARWHGDSKPIAEGMAEPIADGWQNDGPDPDPDPLSVSNETDPPKARAKRSRARAIEDIDLEKAADEHPLLNVQREYELFCLDLKRKGKTWTDYVAAFDHWLTKAEEFRERDNHAPVQRHTPGRNAIGEESRTVAWARRNGIPVSNGG